MKKVTKLFEHTVRDKIAQKIACKKEVKCRAGIIDIVTQDRIIEIKEQKKWKHALGQIISYKADYIMHTPTIILYKKTDKEQYNNILLVWRICKKYDVDLFLYN